MSSGYFQLISYTDKKKDMCNVLKITLDVGIAQIDINVLRLVVRSN